ncbi:hypothetical protein F4774DRAFT_381742 [Daldinia eschscholtzii]|nr:hypothetical protein F4774DRAFT_381742 [Daldinia eschscholtzii]
MPQASIIPDEMLNGPAMTPPHGHVPDFAHPANLNGVAQFTNAICLFSTLTVAVIRTYAKVSGRNKIEIEDVLAFVGIGTYCGSLWCSYHVIDMIGAFPHQWDVRLKDLPSIFYTHHIGFNLCVATSGVWKAAVLLEWIRLFVPHGTRNLFYWAGNSLLAFSALIHIAYIVAENLSCFPYQKIWDPTLLEGYCINQMFFQIPWCFIQPLYITTIILLTQRAIWSLQVTTKKKIAVSFLFLIGLLALASSIARAVAMFQFLKSEDKTYTINTVYLWTLAENTCCFIAICAPWVPKAISNTSSMLRTVVNLLPYDRLPGNNSDRTTRPQSWPAKQARAEGEVCDNGLGYHETRDAAIPLVKYPSASSKTEQGDMVLPRDGILMTTEIVVATDYLDESSAGRNDPWNIIKVPADARNTSLEAYSTYTKEAKPPKRTRHTTVT